MFERLKENYLTAGEFEGMRYIAPARRSIHEVPCRRLNRPGFGTLGTVPQRFDDRFAYTIEWTSLFVEKAGG
jgi:hypothetical protein